MSNVLIGPISIGNDVIMAQNIVMSGLNHGYEDITLPPHNQPVTKKQITLEDEVWIGANVVIVAGVTIGKHAVIAAGSVVTKNIPDYALVVGNPARRIGWMSEYGHKLKFNQEGLAVCPESQEQYRLENGSVNKYQPSDFGVSSVER